MVPSLGLDNIGCDGVKACGFLWPAEFAALKARFEEAMGSFGSRVPFSFDAADTNMEGSHSETMVKRCEHMLKPWNIALY